MGKKHILVGSSLILLIIGFATLSFYPNTDDAAGIETTDTISTKNELRKNFYEEREILVVYVAKDAQLSEKYEKILKRVSLQEQTTSWRSVKINFKNITEATQEDLEKHTVYLVGALHESKMLKALLQGTPFTVQHDGIQLGSKRIPTDKGLLSVLFYPNPWNPKRPLSFLTGQNAENIFAFFEQKVVENGPSFYRQNLDYEVIVDGKRIVMGDFDTSWEIDASTFFDFSKGVEVWEDNRQFRFIGHNIELGPQEIDSIISRTTKRVGKVSTFLEEPEQSFKMTLHFYANMEEKGLMTGNTDHAHIDTLEHTVHSIVNDIYADNHIGKEYALAIYEHLGFSSTDILTHGFPIYFTEQWQEKGYAYWSARLIESGNVLSLKTMMDNDYMALESSLIRDCLAGSLVDFLMETIGRDAFLTLYKKKVLPEGQWSDLEPKWSSYLAALPKRFPKAQAVDRQLPYVKGFNFAHEGYSIYNGYGSTKATESLQKQRKMGSNAMAIVPYSYIEDVHTPAPFRFSNSAGNENDESVIHSTFVAKQLGMYTLLKPQIFVGNSWPGDIEMKNEADWKRFFEDYYRWIRHYAFLAEIHGMDALCIGVEFTKATLSHPEEWRKMIVKTRALFSGHLTYAANWGQEFEHLQFWDALDYIGLNSYYPLSKKDDPSDEELKATFDTIKSTIAKVHQRFKKPIVFTEIGFRSVDHPWKNPHAEADETINEDAQRRCYEVVFKGIENEPWCQGILWWKFPSYLEYRGEHNNAFTPNHKLAEKTVAKWFLKETSKDTLHLRQPTAIR